jgi:hypothetical protein
LLAGFHLFSIVSLCDDGGTKHKEAIPNFPVILIEESELHLIKVELLGKFDGSWSLDILITSLLQVFIRWQVKQPQRLKHGRRGKDFPPSMNFKKYGGSCFPRNTITASSSTRRSRTSNLFGLFEAVCFLLKGGRCLQPTNKQQF